MKTFLLLFVVALLFVSCQNNSEKEFIQNIEQMNMKYINNSKIALDFSRWDIITEHQRRYQDLSEYRKKHFKISQAITEECDNFYIECDSILKDQISLDIFEDIEKKAQNLKDFIQKETSMLSHYEHFKHRKELGKNLSESQLKIAIQEIYLDLIWEEKFVHHKILTRYKLNGGFFIPEDSLISINLKSIEYKEGSIIDIYTDIPDNIKFEHFITIEQLTFENQSTDIEPKISTSRHLSRIVLDSLRLGKYKIKGDVNLSFFNKNANVKKPFTHEFEIK